MTDIEQLRARIEILEAEKQVRACMNSYMHQCDTLDETTSLDNLMALFARGAVWEGIGPLYKKRLGRHEGLTAIRKMFAKYTRPPAHFTFNLHVLGNELIEIKTDTLAWGSWILLQPSDFTDGRSHLNGARITCEFKREQEQWKIFHFQTLNLLSRTMNAPWSEATAFPVPK